MQMQSGTGLCRPKLRVVATGDTIRLDEVSVGLWNDVAGRNNMIVCSADQNVARKVSFGNDAQDVRIASVSDVNGNRREMTGCLVARDLKFGCPLPRW